MRGSHGGGGWMRGRLDEGGGGLDEGGRGWMRGGGGLDEGGDEGGGAG